MAYTPATDFLALLRQTSGGVRTERAPTLDIILATLARGGLINLAVQATAPTANQASTAWLRPAVPSSATAEGTLFLWNSTAMGYEPATPALFYAFLQAGG